MRENWEKVGVKVADKKKLGASKREKQAGQDLQSQERMQKWEIYLVLGAQGHGSTQITRSQELNQGS